ncbi:MAG: pro-sigmaK processing inhibitor BofA family protein [Roseburia sp.]|nr:pro-sigmaK processing inhibitor BofA family protein [Roseburia sp.]MCM1279316.1 pro-sigmaK processing inhibitor BofA family protein [Robinsoniella sp.]
MKMEELWGGCAIILVCILVLAILFFKNKLEVIMGFFMRGVFGALAIYGVNQLLLSFGIQQGVGINPLTLLTSAILGIPGVCVLFALIFI